jgi:hypothetical protein
MMSFVIQNQNLEDRHYFYTNNTDSSIIHSFGNALTLFKHYVEELRKTSNQ